MHCYLFCVFELWKLIFSPDNKCVTLCIQKGTWRVHVLVGYQEKCQFSMLFLFPRTFFFFLFSFIFCVCVKQILDLQNLKQTNGAIKEIFHGFSIFDKSLVVLSTSWVTLIGQTWPFILRRPLPTHWITSWITGGATWLLKATLWTRLWLRRTSGTWSGISSWWSACLPSLLWPCWWAQSNLKGWSTLMTPTTNTSRRTGLLKNSRAMS